VYDILLPLLNDGTRGLESGTTTLIPIWIHYSQIGKISQRFLFNYYSEVIYLLIYLFIYLFIFIYTSKIY